MTNPKAARLVETTISEGNILESPLFKLSNNEARRHRGTDAQGNRLLVEDDYTSVYTLAPGSRITIKA